MWIEGGINPQLVKIHLNPHGLSTKRKGLTGFIIFANLFCNMQMQSFIIFSYVLTCMLMVLFHLQGALALSGMPDAQSKPVLLCSLNDNTVRLYDLPS
jgi:hypothetical protein